MKNFFNNLAFVFMFIGVLFLYAAAIRNCSVWIFNGLFFILGAILSDSKQRQL